MKALAVAVLALALAGCGGAGAHGTATLWVTRDRGAHVLFSGKVPAGLTALQALDRKLDVKTRYGGRFVQSIGGVDGDAGKQRDWFYFVNGVESSQGAADVRLRDGDVEWWDYRSWQGSAMSVPIVVGAFPEPFLHGFEWAKPGATVIAAAADRKLAKKLAQIVHGDVRVGLGVPSVNWIWIDAHVAPGTMRAERHDNRVVLFLGERAARRLASDPSAFRLRYQVHG